MNELLEAFREVHFRSRSWAIYVPLILMAIDIVTGLVRAWSQESFQSAKMRKGLSKKVGEICVLVIGELVSFGLGLPKEIMTGISLYISFMEFMSNMENFHDIGVPIPKFLEAALKGVDDAINNQDSGSAAESTKKIIDDVVLPEKEGESENDN